MRKREIARAPRIDKYIRNLACVNLLLASRWKIINCCKRKGRKRKWGNVKKKEKGAEINEGKRRISRSRYSSNWARRVTSLFARPSALASTLVAAWAGPFWERPTRRPCFGRRYFLPSALVLVGAHSHLFLPIDLLLISSSSWLWQDLLLVPVGISRLFSLGRADRSTLDEKETKFTPKKYELELGKLLWSFLFDARNWVNWTLCWRPSNLFFFIGAGQKRVGRAHDRPVGKSTQDWEVARLLTLCIRPGLDATAPARWRKMEKEN